MPYTRVWDYIPQNAKDAFRLSDHVYFELDLTDGRTASALAECQLLPDGLTLREVLPRSLYKRVSRHMEYIRRRIPDWMGNRKRRGENSSYYSDYQYRYCHIRRFSGNTGNKVSAPPKYCRCYSGT